MFSRPPSRPGHGDAEARAFLGQAVFRRHPAVGEDHLPGRLHVPAHLVLDRAEGKAGRVLRHDEGRDAFRPVGAGPHHGHVDVAVAGAGNELLGAVDHIVVAVAHGPRLQRRRIGAGARLGQAVAAQPFHRGQLRQETLPLFVAAEAVDHPAGHVVDGDEGREAGAGPRQRLEDQHGVEPAEAGAADIVARHRCRRSRAGRSRG